MIVAWELASPRLVMAEPREISRSRAGRDAPPAEFLALYESRREQMVRVARAITGSHQVAEEVVQDAFIRLHAAWSRVDNPPAFLHRVVVNLAKNNLRRTGLERTHAWRAEASQPEVLQPELDEMWAALVELPAKYRVALVLRYYEDLSVDQIAEVMDVRAGTVKSLIHRGLARLEKKVVR